MHKEMPNVRHRAIFQVIEICGADPRVGVEEDEPTTVIATDDVSYTVSEGTELWTEKRVQGFCRDGLAALHQNSKSPNGNSGNLPQMNKWEESWETYFTKSMRWALKLELEAKRHNPEFDVLIPILFDKVIPRLLRPLESEGRSVKPSLVHGDL